MLLQTNSYIVPKERRAEHARLIRRFRQALAHIGCDQFDVYEQIGANWDPAGANGRYVQLMRFRDHAHQQAVQAAERQDPGAQAIIAEFCNLINFPYQHQHGYFATGFYTSVVPVGPQAAEETSAEVPPAQVTETPVPQSSASTSPATTIVEQPADPDDYSTAVAEPEPFSETAGEPAAPVAPAEVPVAGEEPLELDEELSPDELGTDELGAFGLSDDSSRAPTPSRVPPSPVKDETPETELEFEPAVQTSELFDDSDLLDLSAIELTEEEAALHEQMAGHGIQANHPAAIDDSPIMLDATLPEEGEEYASSLDDTRIGEHVASTDSVEYASVTKGGHAHQEPHSEPQPGNGDADLLEFHAFLQEIKEGPAQQKHE